MDSASALGEVLHSTPVTRRLINDATVTGVSLTLRGTDATLVGEMTTLTLPAATPMTWFHRPRSLDTAAMEASLVENETSGVASRPSTVAVMVVH